ncbi:MAG: hypothetical protein LBU66_00430 [Treponema sp.]|nr:hypothetical protein [Treponema sp.]
MSIKSVVKKRNWGIWEIPFYYTRHLTTGGGFGLAKTFSWIPRWRDLAVSEGNGEGSQAVSP